MTSIQISSDKDFSKLVDHLASEVIYARWHLKMYERIGTLAAQYPTEIAQSRTFWGLTQKAHIEAVLLHLCRIYDSHHASLSMRTFLGTVSDNSHLFERTKFLLRMLRNPFAKSLAEDSRRPDESQLRADLISSGNKHSNATRKLHEWRNNLIAHLNAKAIVDERQLAAENPLTVDEVHELLDNAYEIVNRYSRLFNATIQSSMLIGEDDMDTIFKAMRAYLRPQS